MNRSSLDEAEENHGERDLRLCYQCGTCSGGCPVARMFPQYNIRKIVKHKKEDKIDIEDKFLWYCLTCYICYERCPQDIKPVEVIHSIKNFISENGFAPSSLKEGNKKILAVGRSADITGFTERKRRNLGLPKLKTDVSKDFKEIAKITGLTERVK